MEWVEIIVGDDTRRTYIDTHPFCRNADTVLTVVEEKKNDENYELLQRNLRRVETNAFEWQAIEYC